MATVTPVTNAQCEQEDLKMKTNPLSNMHPLQDPQAIHAVAWAAIDGITDSVERDRLYAQASADVAKGISIRQHAAIEIAKSLIAAGTGKYNVESRHTLASDAVLIADTVLAFEAATLYHFSQP
jgi:hypothetical protein